jgi:hypothetical protein
MTGRVFAVQQPSRWDRGTKNWANTHDLGPAGEYGKIEILLGPGNVNQGQQDATALVIQEAMRGFDDSDYILDVGCPVARSIAFVVAGAYNEGRYNLLKWDKYQRRYDLFEIKALNFNLNYGK